MTLVINFEKSMPFETSYNDENELVKEVNCAFNWSLCTEFKPELVTELENELTLDVNPFLNFSVHTIIRVFVTISFGVKRVSGHTSI